MAAGTLPKPGSTLGPCGPHDADCKHTDCALTRAQAACFCRYCGKPIGYERRFYVDDEAYDTLNGQGYAHASCVEDAVSS